MIGVLVWYGTGPFYHDRSRAVYLLQKYHIKVILVLVSKGQMNHTFNDTFDFDINKHWTILTQKWMIL